MSITICPVNPDFVAEIGDVDLSRPADSSLAAIKAAFWKYAVLIFPDQHLTPQQHLDFAAAFGPIEAERVLDHERTAPRLDHSFADISNLDATGRIWAEDSRQRMYKAGNRLWHTDSSFRYRPGLCSLLYATIIAPVGGHTEFADQRAAYDALPEDIRARKVELPAAEASLRGLWRNGAFARTFSERGGGHRQSARISFGAERVFVQAARIASLRLCRFSAFGPRLSVTP